MPEAHADASRRGRATSTTFAGAPTLSGELVVDDESREAVATDLGKIARHMPCAVLRPGSADDIAAMIRFCAEHDIPVSTRGQAHTTLGQGLSGGLVIESRHLDRIHSLGPDVAEVDAGIRWMDLTKAAYAQSPSMTPPVLTGYTGLTVGGTLSVGGIGGLVGGLHTGLQVDHVRELEVVTGTGDVERCSRDHKPDLFEAVLGGLGQCAVITRAVIELVPARQRARTYAPAYTDNGAFFSDLRAVIDRPGVDHVYAELLQADTTLTYKLYATAFYDEGAPPEDAAIADGLSAAPDIDDSGYLDYAFAIDVGIDTLRETFGWDALVKPWLDVWLPGSAAEDYLAELVSTLAPRDIGPYGAVLIYPQRRELLTRPNPRLPEPDGSPWVFVLDLNTVSETPGPTRSSRTRCSAATSGSWPVRATPSARRSTRSARCRSRRATGARTTATRGRPSARRSAAMTPATCSRRAPASSRGPRLTRSAPGRRPARGAITRPGCAAERARRRAARRTRR